MLALVRKITHKLVFKLKKKERRNECSVYMSKIIFFNIKI